MSPHRESLSAPVLVIGSGIAGLTFALKAAERGRVLVVTKKARAESNTNYARGGIAAGMGPDDDPDLHMEDTLMAGAGLCHEDVVELVVREGPERVAELVAWGVRFHRENGRFSLGREGGHSRRRILRAGDRTGREIERALLEAVASNPRIEVLQHVVAVDLLVDQAGGSSGLACRGALAFDHQGGSLVTLEAGATLLASGGCGQVYRHTTNPAIATGDGIAMAYRAGAEVANMEFIQFHPTALYPTEDPAFLLTEAIRGEGGVLRRLDGSSFLGAYHPQGSLAPRDVVARAIRHELDATGDPHVVLDVSAIPEDVLEERFPGTVEGCRERGIDLIRDGIPVVPAAHYVCGGVRTDVHGRTSLPGLFAAGEVACTGVHGANRLASNSLLEAVVFSHRAALTIGGEGKPESAAALATVSSSAPEDGFVAARSDEPGPVKEGAGVVPSLRMRLRDLMWKHAGIVRSDEGLEEAASELERIAGGAAGRWASPGSGVEPPSSWTVEGVEVRNLLQIARLVVESARRRKESRGLHFNRDHPAPDDRFRRDTVLRLPDD